MSLHCYLTEGSPETVLLVTVGVVTLSAPLDAMLTLLRKPAGRCYPTAHFLIDKCVDVHIVSKDGMTLLHFAAALFTEDDALAVIKLLVDARCNPSVLNAAQETPFHIAARHGHLSVINYLLSPGIPFPCDVLLTASDGYSVRTRVIRYLVHRGADTSVATMEGDTPLHLLLANGVEMDHLESAKILVDGGCDPRARNLAGETPLHTAARRGFVTILKYLSSQGIPLPHDILRSSTPETICFLLGKGVDACSVSVDDDKELMHRAIDSKRFGSDEDCLKCAQILVGLGWDPSLRNSSGVTPIHTAIRQGHVAVVKYLLSQTSVRLPADVLLVAVALPTEDSDWRAHDTVQLTRLLISEGASVNFTAPNGNTPLHLTLRSSFIPDSQKESWNVVEILLNHGSDPTARIVDGQTPFDLAEAQGHFFKQNFLRLVQNSRAQHSHTSA